MQNFKGTVSQTVTQTMERGKRILHLVLQKKPITIQAFEELEKEVSDRMIKFVQRIMPKLENAKFDNPESAIKVILLKGLINILKKLVEEYQKSLNPQDQEFIEQVFANEEKNIQLEESKMITDKNKTTIEDDDNMPNNEKGSTKNCGIQ